jgi:ASC-1-like (ASCH) protein
MSPSLRALTDKSDKLISSICKSTGTPVITGEVNDEYRVSGSRLGLDKAEIKLYITIATDVGVGDKLVFANQMKSVVGEVMDYDVHTESGERIDAIFGFRSIMARVVNSPFIIGTTTTLLRKVAEKAVKVYKG